MNRADLIGVLKSERENFIWWFLANSGAIILVYLACFTIWLIHKDVVNILPKWDIFLITGTITMLVTGISYVFESSESGKLKVSKNVFVFWILLLLITFGVIIAIGVKEPRMSRAMIWFVSILIFFLQCFLSSIIWLHIMGVRGAQTESQPTQPQPTLDSNAASDLPKLT